MPSLSATCMFVRPLATSSSTSVSRAESCCARGGSMFPGWSMIRCYERPVPAPTARRNSFEPSPLAERLGLDIHPAVDVELLPRDVARGRIGEEPDEPGDL